MNTPSVDTPLLFATSNQHKLRQIAELLDQPVEQLDIDLPEVQAIYVNEVIEPKARAAWQRVGEPVLVEDTGLYIRSWNDLPGALIRWFLKSVDTDGICAMMAQYERRNAVAETCLGYFDGEDFIYFSGTTEGQIVRKPRGELGFGWDPIFQPVGYSKTFAEMTAKEMALVSMRNKAAHKLQKYLAHNDI